MSKQPIRPQQEPADIPAPGGMPDNDLQRQPFSDKKRAALLRYMAVLFGVAFLLVLLSFLIQIRDSRETISDLNQSNASALQNAGKLQEENQALTAANADLEAELEALQEQAQTAIADRETLEAEADALDEQNQELSGLLAESEQEAYNIQQAYELLLTALDADQDGDLDAMRDALSRLAPLEGSLSDSARARYEILLGKLTTEN